MKFINYFVKKYLLKRISEINFYKTNGVFVQEKMFQQLIKEAAETEMGRKYQFPSIKNIRDFQSRLPLHSYEAFFPYIERILKGEKNLTWKGQVNWFAKSSGTTNDKSKFIPITNHVLHRNHYAAGRDMLALYLNNVENSNIFTGKCLTIGGSHEISKYNDKAKYGDLSAVLIENLPAIYQLQRSPSKRVALMSNYEQKLIKMKQETLRQNITCMAGVPTWTVILLHSLMNENKANQLTDIWKNIEVFFHGGVSFVPYRSQFLSFEPRLRFMETYNASEGFFGLQDDLNSDDLLLLLNRDIFYEFIPLNQIDEDFPKAVSLAEVEAGKIYAMVITTSSGLWRYNIGDTVRFTSINPYKIKIVGRTKLFINAFGEELMIENAEQAVLEACSLTGAVVRDYTVAPIYFHNQNAGGHEWIIEFEKSPNDFNQFYYILDETLKKVNSDYEAKRYKDMALAFPKIHVAPDGLFYQWMKRRNKLGGQNKVPRLANDRQHMESLLSLISELKS